MIRLLLKVGSSIIFKNKDYFWSFFLKFLSILIGIFTLQQVLDVLGKSEYGIWVIILSFISFSSVLDIGMGLTLRNNVTELYFIGDRSKIKNYISTIVYIVLIFITILFFCVHLLSNEYWLNNIYLKGYSNSQINTLINTLFLTILVSCLNNIFSQALLGLDRINLVNIFSILPNLLVFILLKIYNGKILLLDFFIIFFILNFIVFVLMFIYIINKYRFLIPSIKSFRFETVKRLMTNGKYFFVIQLTFLIFNFESNYLILKNFSSSEVALFNVCYKLFGFINAFFIIYLTPFWSSFTIYFLKRDLNSIKLQFKRLFVFLSLTILMTILLIFFYEELIKLWFNRNDLLIGLDSVILIAIYITVLNFSNIYSYFLNAISIIKIQALISFVQTLLLAPFIYLFVNFYSYGLNGVLYAMILCISIFAIVAPIYVKSIVFRNV